MPPRMIDSDYVEICHRTVFGLWRFLATPDMKQALKYALFRAAIENHVDIVVSCWMSNHHHTIVRCLDPTELEGFVRDLHSLTARTTNRMQDERQQVWERDQPQITPIKCGEILLQRIAYIQGNPVRAGIARSRHDYVGLLISPENIDQDIVVNRPDFALGKATRLPEQLADCLHNPVGLLGEISDEEYVRQVREVTDTYEETQRQEHARQGRELPTAAEMRARVAQQWADKEWAKQRPDEKEKAKERAKQGGPPRFFAAGAEAVKREKQRLQKFYREHELSRRLFLSEEHTGEVWVPYGTMRLARMPGVRVDPNPIE